MEYVLQFNDKFEISDDLDILKQIGMLHGKLNFKSLNEFVMYGIWQVLTRGNVRKKIWNE